MKGRAGKRRPRGGAIAETAGYLGSCALGPAFLLIDCALIQTFWRLQHESPGFDACDVAVTRAMTLDDQRLARTRSRCAT